MPKYRVEQYELHAQQYEVEADTIKEAIDKVLGGDGETVANGCEYIQIADRYHQPITLEDGNKVSVESIREVKIV